MRRGGRFGEWSQSLQRQILLAINNSELEGAEGGEERRTRVNGKEGKERRRQEEAGGGRRREEEACVQTVADVGGRLHFSVHLLNVAEMRGVAAMLRSLKALPDV